MNRGKSLRRKHLEVATLAVHQSFPYATTPPIPLAQVSVITQIEVPIS